MPDYKTQMNFDPWRYTLKGTYELARIIDSAGDDQAIGSDIDYTGNVYVGGYYTGTAAIRTQAGVTLATLPASSSLAGVMSKFDPSGTHLLSRIVDSSTVVADESLGVCCDPTGNVYMFGYVTGTGVVKTQANATLTTFTPSLGGTMGYIVKFNFTGGYLYARLIDSTTNDRFLDGVCDRNSNLYACGFYSGTPRIQDGTGTLIVNLPASAGGTDAVLSKFTITGSHVFSVVLGSTGADQGNVVGCDSSGNPYLVGYYAAAANIRNQSSTLLGSLPAPTGTTQCPYLCKFNASNGNFLFGRFYNNSTGDLRGCVCDENDNVYISGTYSGTPTITTHTSSTLITLPASSGNDSFFSKFDSSGNHIFTRIFSGTLGEQGRNITYDATKGLLYFSGFYGASAVNIRTETGTVIATLPSQTNASTAMVSVFNASGSYLYSRFVRTTGADQGRAVSVDVNRNCMYFSGFYSATGTPNVLTQDNVSLGTLPTGGGSNTIFMCKFTN